MWNWSNGEQAKNDSWRCDRPSIFSRMKIVTSTINRFLGVNRTIAILSIFFSVVAIRHLTDYFCNKN